MTAGALRDANRPAKRARTRRCGGDAVGWARFDAGAIAGEQIRTVPGHVWLANRARGEGDQIDLSGIDANSNVAGDQGFTWVNGGFTGTAGEMYSSYDSGTGMTSLFLDVDGDSIADMEILLQGEINLTGGDFII